MSASRVRPSRSSKVRELLKGSGLRCTPARDAVLRFLSQKGHPLAHSEIAKARRLGTAARTALRTDSSMGISACPYCHRDG